MDQAAIIAGVSEFLADDQRLTGLFLSGSYGRGEEDDFSDVDFVAVAEPETHDDVMQAWRSALESMTPLIMWKRPYPNAPLINAITEDWVRCDLYVVAPDAMNGRAKSTLRPLLDPRDLFSTLADILPDAKPSKVRVAATINEFIRVIGMTPIVIGRGEMVTAVQGNGLLRDMLVTLMLEEVTKPDKGGAMHLSKLVSAEDFAELMTLPVPSPSRASILTAHREIAAAFFPRAKRLARSLQIEWPEAFETKTREHLNAKLGLEFD